MSKWTHLSGVVRIDRLFIGEDPLGSAEVALKVARDHFDYGLGYDSFYVYGRLSDTEHLLGKNMVITIEADLEDVGYEGDVERLKTWFTERLVSFHQEHMKDGMSLRDAVLHIEVEDGMNCVLVWTEDKHERVKEAIIKQ
jgi:hypothetical protein